MTKDEALRLALEALESTGENDGYHGIDQYFDNVLVDKAITALRLAIDVENITSKATYKEQLQKKDEPFEYWNAVEGWVKLDEVREHFESASCGTIYKNGGEGRVPLYTTPQRTWVGLTDEEVDQGLLRSPYALQSAGAWRDGVAWAIQQLKDKKNVQ